MDIGGADWRRVDVNRDWFTAVVRMEEAVDGAKAGGQKVYHVHFEGGARTKLHRHNGDQILRVTAGRGSLELFERAGPGDEDFPVRMTGRTDLKEGDMVHVAPGTLHTHGSADPREEFSHVAINIPPGEGEEYRTVWYESGPGSGAGRIIR